MCYFMYVGKMSEVMKTEFPDLIERGVPFEANDLFVDLFVDDPLYVVVDPAVAKEMLGKLKAAADDRDETWRLKEANVASMEDARKLKLQDWKARRDAHRARAAGPAPVLGAPDREPAPRVMPRRKGGDEP